MAIDRRAAQERAHMLLRGLLTDEEFKQFLDDGFLKVKSPSFPNREYRIPAFAGMIVVLDDGKPAMRLCIGPLRAMPAEDVVVTHLLLICGDEQRYLAKANIFPYF